MVFAGQGAIGVMVFFVISGFLITTLLLNERETHGSIDIPKFYVRRAFRIFPAFYVYLVVAAIIASWAGHTLSRATVITAATYTSNYYPFAWLPANGYAWLVSHTWSLSVEEQFYLIWPLVVSRISQRNAVRVCWTLIAVVPLLRYATVLAAPVYQMDQQWFRLFHCQADSLATGCLLALVLRSSSGPKRVEKFFHPLFLLIAVVWLCFVTTPLQSHGPIWVVALFSYTFENAATILLLAWVVLRPRTWAGKLLNLRPLRHIGRISYSLYLWQQIFTGPFTAPTRILNLAGAFLCAEASFWLIERPSLKLRDRLFPSLRPKPRPEASKAPTTLPRP